MFGVNSGLEVDRVVPLEMFFELGKDEGTVTAVTDEGMGLLVMVEVTVSAVMYIVAVAQLSIEQILLLSYATFGSVCKVSL